jgi:PEP-CTERM motif
MTTFTRGLAATALVLAATWATQAHADITVLTTNSLAGNLAITGFADGSPTTFSMALKDMAGTVNVNAFPAGAYTLNAQGSFSFTGFAGPGGTVSGTLPVPTPLFTGFLGVTPAANGSLSFSPGVLGVFDTPLATLNYSTDYSGSATPQLMALINLLTGVSLPPITGAGTLAIQAQVYSDGVLLNMTESNLTWPGFGRSLLLVDSLTGGNNGIIDGTFAMSNVAVTVSAVPEPSSVAMILAGLAAVGGLARHRKTAR